MEPGIHFKEQQHFRQLWLWLILFLFSSFVLYKTIRVLQGDPMNGESANSPELFISVFAMLLVVTLFIFARLDTIIKSDGIYYRFIPFQFKLRKIEWSQISKAYVRKYNAILEYGGWGLRLGIFGKGRAYNVSGNMGLQLELKSGKMFLIGTKKAEEMEEAITKASGVA